jgi:pimeloyl-ACP methyl ester carboxylesterase
MQIDIQNHVFLGADNRPSLVDLKIPKDGNGKLIVFLHGYMGYKDWGCWNLVSDFFVSSGYGFCKYSASHNGTTPDNPTEFLDLEAFGRNNYSKELSDLNQVLIWLENQFTELPQIYLIGHSRGAGIALLKAEDDRIHRIVSWAGISDIAKRFPEGKALEVWKTQGTKYTLNNRTGQKLPNYYSQYEDYIENISSLSIPEICQKSKKPTLVIHGDLDTSVPIEESKDIASWLNTRLFEIEEANHTFGSAEPWDELELPEHLLKACLVTKSFFEIDYSN